MTAEPIDVRDFVSPSEKLKPVPLSTLVASAKRLTRDTVKRDGAKQEGWQADAWDLLDLVGELEFLANSLAGRVGAARLFAGQLNPDDQTQDPERVDDGHPADRALEAFGKTPAARAQMLARESVNLTVAGDGYFVGIPEEMLEDGYSGTYLAPEGVDEEESVSIDNLCWYMLSTSEVKRDGQSGEVKLKLDGVEHTFDPDDIWFIRVWNPHPRFAHKATAPTKSSLPVLRELAGLTMHVSAQIDSRLAGAGVFLVPQEARDAVIAAMGGVPEDADEDWDPFTESLMEAMLKPISDRSNASALVPLVLTVPQETIADFRYISFSTPLDKEAKNLREEAIRRLALGMNTPPEILLGVGGMNHWGAWLVREDTVSTFVEPQLALICDALTTEYLWPVLEQQGVEDFNSYVIWYDVSHLIARPVTLEDGIALHREGVISDSALRDAGNFSDEDALGDDETDDAATIVLKMVQANPELVRNPGIDVILESVRGLLKGTGTPALPGPVVEDGTVDQPLEGELVEERTLPDMEMVASILATRPEATPVNVNVTVEPPEMNFRLEGFTAAAPPPNIVVQNVVEPTPMEVYVTNDVAPTPVTVNNEVNPTPVTVANEVNVPEAKVEVNLPPTRVTVEAPIVNVDAPPYPEPADKDSVYFSGEDGRVDIPSGYAVVAVSAVPVETKDGTVKLGRGQTIPVPRDVTFNETFDVPVKAKYVLFKNTTAYFVRAVQI